MRTISPRRMGELLDLAAASAEGLPEGLRERGFDWAMRLLVEREAAPGNKNFARGVVVLALTSLAALFCLVVWLSGAGWLR